MFGIFCNYLPSLDAHLRHSNSRNYIFAVIRDADLSHITMLGYGSISILGGHTPIYYTPCFISTQHVRHMWWWSGPSVMYYIHLHFGEAATSSPAMQVHYGLWQRWWECCAWMRLWLIDKLFHLRHTILESSFLIKCVGCPHHLKIGRIWSPEITPHTSQHCGSTVLPTIHCRWYLTITGSVIHPPIIRAMCD